MKSPSAPRTVWLDPIDTEAELEDRLSAPTPELIADVKAGSGDVLVLGVGGTAPVRNQYI